MPTNRRPTAPAKGGARDGAAAAALATVAAQLASAACLGNETMSPHHAACGEMASWVASSLFGGLTGLAVGVYTYLRKHLADTKPATLELPS